MTSCVFLSPGLAQAYPLDIPVPTGLTAQDVLSTSGENGDTHGVVPGVDFCRSAPPPPVSLPQDDGPHPTTYLEFWQWPITLHARDGSRVAYFVTFENKPELGQGLVQVSRSSAANGRFDVLTERMAAPSGRPGRVTATSPHVSIEAGSGHDELHFRIGGDDVDLEIDESKPPVIQLGDGHVTLYCNSFSLYSRYRMHAQGTVHDAAGSREVVGTSSFDHLWGFYPGAVAGQTIALKLGLDNGLDAFVGIARTPDGQAAGLQFGAVSDKHGRTTTLHAADATLTPVRYWQRDATCRYPVAWDVRIGTAHFHVEAVIDGAELRATDPAVLALWPEFPAYWDGEVVISGDASGRGWLDLTHFCGV